MGIKFRISIGNYIQILFPYICKIIFVLQLESQQNRSKAAQQRANLPNKRTATIPSTQQPNIQRSKSKTRFQSKNQRTSQRTKRTTTVLSTRNCSKSCSLPDVMYTGLRCKSSADSSSSRRHERRQAPKPKHL